METIILNNSPKTEKIFHKNKKTSVENFDLLANQERKKKKSKKNSKRNTKSKKKYTGLKDLLNDINKENIIQTNKKNTDKNSNEKIDDSEINFSEKLENETKTRDISELDSNEFTEFSISPISEIRSPSQKFFSMTPIEEEQFNNINDNNKRKMTFSICSYYNGYDKFLSETETSTIDLSTSLNFIKKEKFEENFSEEIENNNSNININKDIENNTLQNNNNIQNININNNYNVQFIENPKNLQNYGYMQEIVLLDSKYSKFDIYNNDYYVNYKFNINGNYIVRRRGDWLCEKCGNYNYSFRDVCNRCKNPKL